MLAHLCRPIRFGIDRAMKLPPAKRLLLWVHDVSPQIEAEVDRQHEVLSRFASANRIELLVVPNHSGNAPIWAPRLRTKRGPRAEQGGAEIVLFGYPRRNHARHSGTAARLVGQARGSIL